MNKRYVEEMDYNKQLEQHEKQQSRKKSRKQSVAPLMRKKPVSLMMPKLSEGQIDLASSLTSGFLTGVLTNPMDVVTARLMTQPADFAKDLLPGFRASVKAPYRGLFDCMSRMMREEGPGAFMIGVRARVTWIAPFVCISLGLNNVFKRGLKAWKMKQAELVIEQQQQQQQQQSKSKQLKQNQRRVRLGFWNR
jgi:Mitochondrial carrier protein